MDYNKPNTLQVDQHSLDKQESGVNLLILILCKRNCVFCCLIHILEIKLYFTMLS